MHGVRALAVLSALAPLGVAPGSGCGVDHVSDSGSCDYAVATTCPEGAEVGSVRYLQWEGGGAFYADPALHPADDPLVEQYTDWSALSARLADLGQTLGTHEELDFTSQQVVLAWEYSGSYCDDGNHLQGITSGGLVEYAEVDPCDTSCDTSSVWFGNLLVAAAGELGMCRTTITCEVGSEDSADVDACPETPNFTMLNAS